MITHTKCARSSTLDELSNKSFAEGWITCTDTAPDTLQYNRQGPSIQDTPLNKPQETKSPDLTCQLNFDSLETKRF